MDRIIIRIHIPKIDLSEAVGIKITIQKLLEDVEGAEVELTAFSIRE